MRIAFLGLGRMGRELVAHVIAAGHDVTVWNRTEAATADAAARGATVAASPADAVVRAEAVVTMLFGPAAVREVVTSPGLAIPSGSLWIDATTIAPSDVEEFARWAASAGVRYVYSPVIGTTGPAHAGTLGVLIGGAPDAVEAARPIVSLWADPDRIRTFDQPQLASAAKLIANLSVAVVAEGIAEALRLGRAAGFDAAQVLDVLPLTQFAQQAGLKNGMLRAQNWHDTQFSVDALLKDTGFMAELAAGAGTALPALDAFTLLLRAAEADGLGSSDYIAAVRGELEQDEAPA